ESVEVNIDSLQWLGGAARGHATVNWTEALRLQAGIEAEGFQLARLDAALEAEVGAQMRVDARLDDTPDIQVQLDALSGHWRGAPLSGQGELRLLEGELAPSELRLAAGQSRLELKGAAGQLAFML